ncbi:hypothetical protein EDB84DRAFT_1445437 [Lactarius hengduanensis]|nr:hypothetical protein EDB84DRAFT_1445437 [Lactarius hengduanensis]
MREYNFEQRKSARKRKDRSRLVLTGLASVYRFSETQRDRDRTAIGPGLVQSQSFSSLETGLPNTTQQALRDKEAEQQRREAEKKKPKIGSFVKGRGVGNWIEPRPAQYALNKINNLEYIELDYFTIRGCRDAATDSHKSISQDTMAFAQVEDTLAIRPLAAVRPSRNIRSDENLSWDEVMYAKNTMLHFMAQSRVWPLAHVESLAAFFVALELHPRRVQDNGNDVLILYQSRV